MSLTNSYLTRNRKLGRYNYAESQAYITPLEITTDGATPPQRMAETCLAGRNRFQSQTPTCQPWRTFSDSETDLKVVGGGADGASTFPQKNPNLLTQTLSHRL